MTRVDARRAAREAGAARSACAARRRAAGAFDLSEKYQSVHAGDRSLSARIAGVEGEQVRAVE